ncbi:MAG: GNAT family protein, partial [Gaiellaceae bacterium]
MDTNVEIRRELVTLVGIGGLDPVEFLDLRTRNYEFWKPYSPPMEASLHPEAQPRVLEQLNRMWADNHSLFFGIRSNDSASLVGIIALENIARADGRMSADLGYAIDRDNLRKGYALDAVSGSLAIAFEGLLLRRVVAGVQPDNHRSIKLLEKIGFQFEGVAR